MELISGLPEEMVRECFTRVSYDQLSTVASVCKGWKAEIEHPEFLRTRKASGLSQKLIVMAQARVDLNMNNQDDSFSKAKSIANPSYGITIFDSGRNKWSDLALPPELSSGLPMFCQLTGVGYNLVLLGGWDPITWKASSSVFIYNFVSAKWHRGTDMPGGPRTFFACASDSDRTVYIAGGHDDEKNALKSALAYDVESNEWILLDDMASERDECKGIFHRGKFHVIGGYSTDMQGQFGSSSQVFDIMTKRWGEVNEDFLTVAACPRTCAGRDDKEVVMCIENDLMALKDGTWQVTARLPAEICNIAMLISWVGTLLVMGSSGFAEPHVGYSFDLKNQSWRKLEMCETHTGHVQSCCLLDI